MARQWRIGSDLLPESEHSVDLQELIELFYRTNLSHYDENLVDSEAGPGNSFNFMQLVKMDILNETWKSFAVHTNSLHDTEKMQNLIMISKKQIEYNGEDCQLLFLQDSTVALQLKQEKQNFKKEITENNRFLTEIYANLKKSAENNYKMLENCRPD